MWNSFGEYSSRSMDDNAMASHNFLTWIYIYRGNKLSICGELETACVWMEIFGQNSKVGIIPNKHYAQSQKDKIMEVVGRGCALEKLESYWIDILSLSSLCCWGQLKKYNTCLRRGKEFWWGYIVWWPCQSVYIFHRHNMVYLTKLTECAIEMRKG